MILPNFQINDSSSKWGSISSRCIRNGLFIAFLSGFGGILNATFFVVIQRLASGQLLLQLNIIFTLFLLYLLTMIISIFATQVTLRVSSSFAAELRYMLAGRVIQSPLIEIEKQGLARITGNMLEDVNLLTNVIDTIPSIAQNCVIVLCIIFYVIFTDWKLGITVVIFSLSAGTLTVLVGLRIREKVRGIWQQGAVLRELATDMVIGMKELKLNSERHAKFLRENYALALRAHRDKAADAASSQAFLQSVLRGASLLGILLVVCYSSATGHRTMNIQGLLVLMYGIGPLGFVLSAASNWAQLGRTYAGILRLAENLGESENLSADFKRSNEWCIPEIRDIVFRYSCLETETSSFMIGPVSLKLAPGTIFAVAGPNGAGKTTFVKILAGLYRPESGGFTLDDRPIEWSKIQEYRNHFCAIFSEYHLFSELLPGAKVREEDLLQFLHLVEMFDKVELLNLRFSKTALSSGQRKRLALLEVFAQDRPVIILDEWAAEQDSHNRQIFYKEILPFLRSRGKCLLVISHDKEVLTVADSIVYVQDGQVTVREVVHT